MDIDWAGWERLIAERGVEIDRPRGTDHPRYPGWTYPLDYGHIPGTLADDGHEVDVFRGSASTALCAAFVVRHDGHEELKLLWNVDESEAQAAYDFLADLPYIRIIWRTERGTKARQGSASRPRNNPLMWQL